MSIDASIPLRVKPVQFDSAADSLGKVLPIVNAANQIRLGDLQYSKLTRDIADEEATKAALGDYMGKKITLADLARVSPSAYFKVSEAERKAVKDEADIAKARAETIKAVADARVKHLEAQHKNADRFAAILGAATDETSYGIALATLRQQFGAELVDGKVPEKYDPAFVRTQMRAALSAKDQLDLQLKEAKQRFDEIMETERLGLDARRTVASETGASASMISARAAASNAETARQREERERSEAGNPQGAPIKVRNQDTGAEELVYRNKRGELLDVNTRKPITWTAGPEVPPLAVGDAGRLAMIKQGELDADRAIDLLFTKGADGKPASLRRVVAAEMRAPMTAGGWSDDSRQAYTYIRNSVAGKLRAETGAAAPASEIEDIARRFMPSPIDGTPVALDKVERLREFFTMSLDELERAGYVSKQMRSQKGSTTRERGLSASAESGVMPAVRDGLRDLARRFGGTVQE
jgi:hypothetical protein